MYSYPLKIKNDGTPASNDIAILDAEKNEVLFRPKITEAMVQGTEPCILFTDKATRQPIYNTLFQEKNGGESFLIRTPGEVIMGELVGEAAHTWKVMDENGNPLATIQEKSSWKNSCLFQILTFPLLIFSDTGLMDILLKMGAPHRYFVILNGKKVLQLREMVSTISDDYSLKKSGEFSEREEALLLVSLITALGLKE